MKEILIPTSIKDRFFRKTIAHPEGGIFHHGDCYIFDVDIEICTCGLIHDAIYYNLIAELGLSDHYDKHIKQINKLRYS